MKIYVLRHGEAEPRKPGVADADRALTPRGRKDVRAVLNVARVVIETPQRVISSPLRRARQTAELVVAAFPGCPLVLSDALKPSASPTAIWKELAQGPTLKSVILAGHEPHLSKLVAFLLEAPLRLDFKKGALLRIDVPDLNGPPRGVLKSLLTPKLARAL